MSKKKKPASPVNEGIQANIVRADVLAVGSGAQASKISIDQGSSTAFVEALSSLRSAIEARLPASEGRKELEAVLNKLDLIASKKAPAEDAPGALQTFIEKLRKIGIVIAEVADIAEPLKRIASLLGMSLGAIGLL